MLSCKEAIGLVSEKLDRDLPFWRRLSLRLHVLMCRACSRYTRQITTLDRVVAEHYHGDRLVEPSPPISPESQQRIKASVRAAASGQDSSGAE